MFLSILFRTNSFAAQNIKTNGSKCSKTLIILNTLSGSKFLPEDSTSLSDSFSFCKRFFIRSDLRRPKIHGIKKQTCSLYYIPISNAHLARTGNKINMLMLRTLTLVSFKVTSANSSH